LDRSTLRTIDRARAQIIGTEHGHVPSIFPLHFLEVQGLGIDAGNDARAAAQLNDIEVQFDKQPDENASSAPTGELCEVWIPSCIQVRWLPDTPEQKP